MESSLYSRLALAFLILLFDYSNLTIVKDNDSWLVSFDLKNTGKKDAAEVAQVYVGCVNPTLPRPLKELKGFEKVFLKHGESRRIQVKLILTHSLIMIWTSISL